MRRLLAAVCAALTVFALVTACSGTTGTPHGHVTAKEHDPARTTWTTHTRYRRECTTKKRGVGKESRTNRSCRKVPNGTQRTAHRSSECWELKLDTGDELCVTATKWLKTRVGDHI